jgi:hypothetical protein
MFINSIKFIQKHSEFDNLYLIEIRITIIKMELIITS